MTLRLSGHFSTFCLVFFVLKSLLGIARQWSLDKFPILALRPRSHVRILLYRTWAIVFHFPRNRPRGLGEVNSAQCPRFQYESLLTLRRRTYLGSRWMGVRRNEAKSSPSHSEFEEQVQKKNSKRVCDSLSEHQHHFVIPVAHSCLKPIYNKNETDKRKGNLQYVKRFIPEQSAEQS